MDPNNSEEELKLRIMDLEAELRAASSEIDRLKAQAEQAQVEPSLGRDNEVYALDRRATLSESKNREHSSALALSMKKIMGLEQSIKMYKFTAKDVAKCLGDCVHDGVTMNVSKEELEEMHTAAVTANSQAADATLSLRLAQKTAEINAMLDAELQQALRDVPPSLREKIRAIPSFDDALGQHSRGADVVRGDLYRLLSSVEEAALHFDQEIDSIVPEEGDEQRMVKNYDRGSPTRQSLARSETGYNMQGGGGSVNGGGSIAGGSIAGSRPGSRPVSTDDVGFLTMSNFFKV